MGEKENKSRINRVFDRGKNKNDFREQGNA